MAYASNPPPPKHDYAPVLRRLLKTALFLAVLAAAAYWSWLQPFMAKPRMLWTLSRMPSPDAISMPVDGIDAARVADSFGAPRGRGRSHAGIDIFAERGTPVLSATRGLVISIRDSGLGGKQVWVLGPARERYYYAHLDAWAEGLDVGDVVWPGDLLGSVGNSGNAHGTPPHLHIGIYGAAGAHDPLPLLGPAMRAKDVTP